MMEGFGLKDLVYSTAIAFLLLAVVVLGRTVDRLTDIAEGQTELWQIHVGYGGPQKDSTVVAPPVTFASRGE